MICSGHRSPSYVVMVARLLAITLFVWPSKSTGNASTQNSTTCCPTLEGYRFDVTTGLCIILLPDWRTWDKSQENCKSRGDRLVWVDTVDKRNFFKRVVNADSFWLGGYRSNSGDWVWSESVAVSFGGWTPLQPDGSGGCMVVGSWSQYDWDDTDCSVDQRAVCEKVMESESDECPQQISSTGTVKGTEQHLVSSSVPLVLTSTSSYLGQTELNPTSSLSNKQSDSLGIQLTSSLDFTSNSDLSTPFQISPTVTLTTETTGESSLNPTKWSIYASPFSTDIFQLRGPTADVSIVDQVLDSSFVPSNWMSGSVDIEETGTIHLMDTPWSDVTLDTLYSDVTQDTLWSGVTQDTLYSDVTQDTLWSDVTHDTLYSDVTHDTLWSGVTQDTLYSDVTQDTLWRGVTQDTLWSDVTLDTLWSSVTQDTLWSGVTQDTLWSGVTQDTLWSDVTLDTLWSDATRINTESSISSHKSGLETGNILNSPFLQATSFLYSSERYKTSAYKSDTYLLTTTASMVSVSPAHSQATMLSSNNCRCFCDNNNLSSRDLEKKQAEIRERLLIDKSKISKIVAKYTSAPDERRSSVSIGSMGIVILVICFCPILIGDLRHVKEFFVTKLKRIQT